MLFYGVFYHLKHPQLALERIRSICTGDLLFQTAICEEPAVSGVPWARFHPHGLMSGSRGEQFDPTVFWLFNSACCLAMLDQVGFTDVKVVSNWPQLFVASASSPERPVMTLHRSLAERTISRGTLGLRSCCGGSTARNGCRSRPPGRERWAT